MRDPRSSPNEPNTPKASSQPAPPPLSRIKTADTRKGQPQPTLNKETLGKHNAFHDLLWSDDIEAKRARVGSSSRMSAAIGALGISHGIPCHAISEMVATFDGMKPLERYVAETSAQQRASIASPCISLETIEKTTSQKIEDCMQRVKIESISSS